MITVDEVTSIADGLTARAEATAAKLRAPISWVNSWREQYVQAAASAGALEMISRAQIPAWKARGLELANDYTDDPAHENSWRAAGREFDKAIGEIDGYAGDARLSVVVADTARATAADAGKLAADGVVAAAKVAGDIVPWYVYAGAVGVLALVVAVYAKSRSV